MPINIRNRPTQPVLLMVALLSFFAVLTAVDGCRRDREGAGAAGANGAMPSAFDRSERALEPEPHHRRTSPDPTRAETEAHDASVQGSLRADHPPGRQDEQQALARELQIAERASMDARALSRFWDIAASAGATGDNELKGASGAIVSAITERVPSPASEQELAELRSVVERVVQDSYQAALSAFQDNRAPRVAIPVDDLDSVESITERIRRLNEQAERWDIAGDVLERRLQRLEAEAILLFGPPRPPHHSYIDISELSFRGR